MARKKAAAMTDFEPDALMIRTTDRDGKSYGGFVWPQQVGALVEAPDWNEKPVCGGGLHGLLDGAGDWSLLADGPDTLWWIVEVRRDEAVAIDDDKVKVPRGRVAYFGAFPGAMTRIMASIVPAIQNRSPVASSGYSSPATVSGKNSVAAAVGLFATACAGDGGAICLAAYDDDWNLVAVRAAMVGQDGIEPGVTYRLTEAGEFERVD